MNTTQIINGTAITVPAGSGDLATLTKAQLRGECNATMRTYRKLARIAATSTDALEVQAARSGMAAVQESHRAYFQAFKARGGRLAELGGR